LVRDLSVDSAGREVDRLRRPHLLQCAYDRDPPLQVELL
jgi:hypothetical protein